MQQKRNTLLYFLYKTGQNQLRASAMSLLAVDKAAQREKMPGLKKKFNMLSKKVYLANIINFLSERNKLKKDDLKSFLKQEVSHLCGHKWCINQQHITRESHKLNCARRDNCKDKCRCEEQERMPRCV